VLLNPYKLVAEFPFEAKKEKLAQYAERVWNITEGSVEEKANQGIAKMEEFFQSLGIKTKLSDYTENYKGTAELVEKTFLDRKWLALGERGIVKPEDAKKIVEMSY
jgi:NADP-dependent alcohol dehydrogenase